MKVFDLLKSRIDKMEEKRDVKGLILALKDDDEIIRKESARALGNLGSEEALEPLTQTLEDQDKGVKEEAITALGKIGSTQATPALIEALNSQYISIRWRAAQALGKIGSEEAIEPLTQTLQDPDKGVKEEAITALGRITIKPYLKDLESDQSTVKEDAIQEIKQADGVRISEVIKNIPEEESYVQLSEESEVEEDAADVKEEDTEKADAIIIDLYHEELKKKGYYHLVEKFATNARFSHQDRSEGENDNYTLSDIKKLQKLLEYKGINLDDNEIDRLVREEIKNQNYLEFEEKIMDNHPTTKKDYLEQYIIFHPQETTSNRGYLERLLKKQKISSKDLDNDIEEIRQKKEIREFENKLSQTAMGAKTSEKGSPSIVLKFIKKELVEKRDKLISSGNYHFIENFVHMSKYDYQINDLHKLKKLLEDQDINFQDEELLWLVQEEIKNQEYREFEEKIMENYPTIKQHYLEQYVQNYLPESDMNLKNLRKLLQKQNMSSINLEKEIKDIREKNEIREFEEKLFHEQDSPYESIPVTESKVSKDKDLKNAQILCNLGNLFHDLGKQDEAINYYDNAISTYPEHIGAWINKGLILYTLGMPQKAARCFYHVLKLDPEYGGVWLDIGVILFEMGHNREAQLCYEKAMKIQSGNIKELSSYTLRFLHRYPFYQNAFEKYLNSVSRDELGEEKGDTSSIISKIMRLLS